MGRMKKRIQKMSLKKAFVLFMFCSLLAGILVATLAAGFLSSITYRLEGGASFYFNENGALELFGLADSSFLRSLAIFASQTVSLIVPVALLAASFFMAASAFYRFKLKTPIETLGRSADKIGANDLAFTIDYQSGDEMGTLCAAFEKMRRQLEQNNREMWRMMEERKRLSAAFAHDLRTPLTVLKGYAEFLEDYLPQDKVSPEKVLETVRTMAAHIARLEAYAQNMSRLQKLEDISPSPISIKPTALFESLREAGGMLAAQKEKQIAFLFQQEAPGMPLCVDTGLVMQAADNLFSNALTYARSRVQVGFRVSAGVLTLTVADDGGGFTEEGLSQAAKPFYRADGTSSGPHFGLGLYICKILCEKHGGSLSLENSPAGGALVTARFAFLPLSS